MLTSSVKAVLASDRFYKNILVFVYYRQETSGRLTPWYMCDNENVGIMK